MGGFGSCGAGGGAEERNILNLWQLSPAGLKSIDNDAFAARLRDQGYRYYVADEFGARQTAVLHQSLIGHGKEIARFSPSRAAYPPPVLRTTILVPYAMHNLYSVDRFGPVVIVVQEGAWNSPHRGRL